MNHKRRRPKHQRAGCLACKPHKDERVTKVPKRSDARRLVNGAGTSIDGALAEYGYDSWRSGRPWWET